MRKILLFLALMSLSVALSADFVFDFGPFDPLFPNQATDPRGISSSLHYLHQLSSTPEGNNILVKWHDKNPEDPDYFQVVDHRQWSEKFNNHLHLRVGTGVSILRFSFDDHLKLDATIQAGLNTVFASTGGADNLGMDGTFFVGAEAEIANAIAIRFGLRHYSGHVGDEIMMNAMSYLGTNRFDAVQYTRDNYLEAGLGFVGSSFINGSLTLMMPNNSSWWDPVFHIPDSIEPLPGECYKDRLPEEWAVRGDYGASYKAYIVMLDLAMRLPITEKIALRGGINFKLNQDGMTNHTLTPLDDKAQWEAETSLLFALDFENAFDNKTLSLEFIYHNGRFPLLNYFWKRSSYISAGLSIS